MNNCQCELAGYCERHKVHKNQLAVNLCKNNRDIFLKWEIESGNITEPGIIDKTKNYSKAMIKHVVTGMNHADEEERNRRTEICKSCPLMDKFYNKCKACGCPIENKVKLASSTCPDNPPRW